MRRMIALILALAMLIGAAALAETETDEAALRKEIERLKTENERLRAENERLSGILASYADPSVIVHYDGGSVRFDEVYAAYLEVQALYKELYEALGYEYEEDPEEALDIQRQLAVSLADEAIVENYLQANGIALLSEEEIAALKAEAQAEYEAMFGEAQEFFLSEGYTEKEAAELTQAYMTENALDLDTLTKDSLKQAKDAALTALLVGKVEVDESELLAAYSERLDYEKEYYTAYPEEYAFDSLYAESPISFIPEGYRRARMVVIPFSEEAMAAYDELYMLGQTASPEADALFEALLPEAESVYERLLAGESFDDIRAEYPDTAYYMDEFGGDEGFAISAGSYIFDEETTGAILSLMSVGSITRPLRNDWGYAIFEYAGDIESGEVPFEDMRDALYEIAVNDKSGKLYEEAMEKLRQDAGVIYFFDRLN